MADNDSHFFSHLWVWGWVGQLSFSLQIQWVCSLDSHLTWLPPSSPSGNTYWGMLLLWKTIGVQVNKPICANPSLPLLTACLLIVLWPKHITWCDVFNSAELCTVGGCWKVTWQSLGMYNREWRIGTAYPFYHTCMLPFTPPTHVTCVIPRSLHSSFFSLYISMDGNYHPWSWSLFLEIGYLVLFVSL